MQIECSNCWKVILPIFLCFNSFIFYICYYVAVKKEKNEMSFKFSIGASRPIFEITAHVCRLKRLETWLIKDQVFSSQESESTMSYILGVKWLSGYMSYEIMNYARNKSKTSPFYGIYKVYLKRYCFDRLRLIDNNQYEMFLDMM